MSAFSTFFSKIAHIFTSPKAQQVARQIAAAADKALPIIAEIEQVTGGNKNVDSVLAVYKKFGVPEVQAVASGTNYGAALLNVAVTVLSSEFPGVPWSTLQTGAQVAFSAFKSRS